MKRSIVNWQIMGFAITSLVGTLLHFLFDWLNEAQFIAPFSAINESTFEHMKIFFWPTFIFAIIQSLFFKEQENFFCIKLRGILLGLILIPTLFYLYNGAIGKSPDWFNIAIFFVSAAVSFIYETKQFANKETICLISQKLSFAILCLVSLSFILFTFYTPEIEIFRDPLTKTFGI